MILFAPKPDFLQHDGSVLWMNRRQDAFAVVIGLLACVCGFLLALETFLGVWTTLAPLSRFFVRVSITGLIACCGLWFRREPGARPFRSLSSARKLEFPDDFPWALTPRDDGRGAALTAARFDLAAVWFFILAMWPALSSGKELDTDLNVTLGLSLLVSPILLGAAWWRYRGLKRVRTAYGPGRILFPNAPVKKGKTVNVVLTTKEPIPNLRAVLWAVREWVRGTGEDQETGRKVEDRFPVEISGERNPDGTWTTVFSADTSPTTDPTELWTREPRYWQLRVAGGDPRAPYRAAFFVPVY